MLRLLRSRWLAVLLLVCSPGGAGVLLPALHPCQAEAGADHAAHGGEHGSGSHESGTGGQCTCVGSCHVPALLATHDDPGRELAASIRLDGRTPSRPVAVSTVRVRPADRLPLPTAPPLT